MSVYDYRKHSRDVYKNTGYDYEGRIFMRNISGNLLKNRHIKGFVIKMELIVNLWLKEIKKLKISNNYAIDKNTTYIN
jgi:hypothetical protein